MVQIVNTCSFHVEADEYYDRKQDSVDWDGPNGDGVVVERVFEICHHVFTDVSVERRDELQADLDGHQDHEYDPVVFVFGGETSSVASYCVNAEIYLLHPPSLRLLFLFKNTQSS